MERRGRSRLLASLLAALLLSPPLAAQGYPLEEGRPFPDLRLPTLDGGLDGKRAAVSDFRGKKLLLIVFASW